MNEEEMVESIVAKLKLRPEVAKVVLMTLERMTLYLEKHPNVIKDIATNCAVVDEELNEFPNAKISRWFNPRTPNATIQHNKKKVG